MALFWNFAADFLYFMAFVIGYSANWLPAAKVCPMPYLCILSLFCVIKSAHDDVFRFSALDGLTSALMLPRTPSFEVCKWWQYAAARASVASR